MRFTRPHILRTCFALAALVALGGPVAASAAADTPKLTPEAMLARLVPSVAVRTHDVHVVPLVSRGVSDADRALGALHASSHVLVTAGTSRSSLQLENTGSRHLLVPSGSVFFVDGREHVSKHTQVLAPDSTLMLDTLISRPGSGSEGARRDPIVGAMAPPYVRSELTRSMRSASLRTFLGRFDGFLATDVAARAAAEPTFAQLDIKLNDRGAETEALPASLKDPRVVGFLTIQNGTVQTLELFGSHELMLAYAPRLLRAHSYKREALGSHGDTLGVLRATSEDPVGAAREATRLAGKFLARLRTQARFRSEQDDDASRAWSIAWRGARGSVHAADNRLVHAAVHAHIPYARALFSRDVDPKPEPTTDQEGLEVLERKSARGTTTEVEERRVKRISQRR